MKGEDLHFPISVNVMVAPKPTITCWGCGVVEQPGQRFKQCPMCVQIRVIPCKFCSNECFHSSWKRHAAWHAGQKKQFSLCQVLSSFAVVPKAATTKEAALDVLTQTSEYDVQLAKAKNFINMLDIASAHKELRKAVHLDVSRPEAYFGLGVCSEASGLWKHAAFYYERSIEQWALVSLRGITVDGTEADGRSSWALQQWTTAIDFTTRLYLTRELADHPKPEWFCVDGLLKIVAKTAAEAAMADSESSMKKKTRLALLHASVVYGIVGNGQYQTESVLRTSNASCQELLEAAACFRFVVTAFQAGNAETELDSRDIVAYRSHARTCAKMAQLKMMKEANGSIATESTLPHIPPVGSWVAIQDLAPPNLGQILGAPEYNENLVPIKVDGMEGEGTELISPINLVQIPQDAKVNALVACLERDAQLSFMSRMFSQSLVSYMNKDLH